MQHVCMKMMFIILFYLFYFCSILMHFNATCLHDSDVYIIFVLFIFILFYLFLWYFHAFQCSKFAWKCLFYFFIFCGIFVNFNAACLYDNNVYYIILFYLFLWYFHSFQCSMFAWQCLFYLFIFYFIYFCGIFIHFNAACLHDVYSFIIHLPSFDPNFYFIYLFILFYKLLNTCYYDKYYVSLWN